MIELVRVALLSASLASWIVLVFDWREKDAPLARIPLILASSGTTLFAFVMGWLTP